MGHTGLRPSTITKCGGKGAAFIRPGAPSYQFVSGARRAARAAMAANDSMNTQQIEYGETEAKVLAIIDTHNNEHVAGLVVTGLAGLVTGLAGLAELAGLIDAQRWVVGGARAVCAVAGGRRPEWPAARARTDVEEQVDVHLQGSAHGAQQGPEPPRPQVPANEVDNGRVHPAAADEEPIGGRADRHREHGQAGGQAVHVRRWPAALAAVWVDVGGLRG